MPRDPKDPSNQLFDPVTDSTRDPRCRKHVAGGRCTLMEGHTQACVNLSNAEIYVDGVLVTDEWQFTEGEKVDSTCSIGNGPRWRKALEEIAAADPVDLALDPTWSQRIAKEALR